MRRRALLHAGVPRLKSLYTRRTTRSKTPRYRASAAPDSMTLGRACQLWYISQGGCFSLFLMVLVISAVVTLAGRLRDAA